MKWAKNGEARFSTSPLAATIVYAEDVPAIILFYTDVNLLATFPHAGIGKVGGGEYGNQSDESKRTAKLAGCLHILW